MRPRRTALHDAVAGDGDWLGVMASLTVLELGWWAFAWRAGAAPAPLFGTYLLLAFGGLAGALALRLAIGLGIPRGSSAAIIGGTFLVAVGASAFLPLKYAIPSEIPFWLDRPLAVGERAILGSDPWLLLDQAIGRATRPMDWLYGSWLPVQLVVMFLVLLSPPSREKSRLLISYSLAWFVLGAVGAVLLSSAGPLFYDRAFGGVDFAALAHTLRNRGAWIAIAESDRMWASFGLKQPGLVAGISAMPSIHVAVSLWIVFVARSLAPRLLGAATAYFILIWVGSVQLGWHYVSDGLVGALGMWGIWGLARLVVRPAAAP